MSELNRHLAVALGEHIQRSRRNGKHVPDELVELRELVLAVASGKQLPEVAPPSLLLTKLEAAQSLRCSKRTVERLIARGELSGISVGPRGVRVPRSELIAYIDRKSEGAVR